MLGKKLILNLRGYVATSILILNSASVFSNENEINTYNEVCTKMDVLYQSNGEIYCEPETLFIKRFNVDGIARIPYDEFITIPQYKFKQHVNNELSYSDDKKHFTRFNMEKNDSIVGGLYLVLPIIRAGKKGASEDDYVSPLLSTDESMVYRVDSIQNHVNYKCVEQLVATEQLSFDYSISQISDVDSLKKIIVDNRYGVSHSYLTRDERISKGVAITSLSLIELNPSAAQAH